MSHIILIDADEPVVCTQCGRRAEVSDEPVGEDHDGPIYEANCLTHGTFKWQVDPDT